MEEEPKAEKSRQKEQPNNPMHGITLKVMLTELVDEVGWEKLGDATGIQNFYNRPTLPSRLKFLRTTPWAREKVENFYLQHITDGRR